MAFDVRAWRSTGIRFRARVLRLERNRLPVFKLSFRSLSETRRWKSDTNASEMRFWMGSLTNSDSLCRIIFIELMLLSSFCLSDDVWDGVVLARDGTVLHEPLDPSPPRLESLRTWFATACRRRLIKVRKKVVANSILPSSSQIFDLVLSALGLVWSILCVVSGRLCDRLSWLNCVVFYRNKLCVFGSHVVRAGNIEFNCLQLLVYYVNTRRCVT
jgi:hypothetical protein